jgi:hypothetical protein
MKTPACAQGCWKAATEPLLPVGPRIICCEWEPEPDPLIFADGFESGDTSNWSGVVP